VAGDLRAEILRELARINGARLSQREEIVARYNLFLMIMEAADSPKLPHVPPSEYQRSLKYVYPVLEPQTRLITEVFSDSFYGELSVEAPRFKDYRRAVSAVFRHFVG
jgi:hypothetical protein